LPNAEGESQNGLCCAKKNVESLPPFEATILGASKRGESLECDEQWTFVQSKKEAVWLWLCISYLTGQVVSFAFGKRDLKTAKQMWERIPKSYRHKQVYTDGYIVYEYLIAWGRHWQCAKGSGGTSVIEGVNNAHRQTVSYLTRKGSAFARKREWLERRFLWVMYHRNSRIKNQMLKVNLT